MKKLLLVLVAVVLMVPFAVVMKVAVRSSAKHAETVATEKAAETEKAKERDAYLAAHPQAQETQQPPQPIYATTPVALTLDYAFNIETDGQTILVKYPGEAPFPYKGRCQKLPEPRMAGPKQFMDPNNPATGHINFRIYPIRIGDVPPCPSN